MGERDARPCRRAGGGGGSAGVEQMREVGRRQFRKKEREQLGAKEKPAGRDGGAQNQ